MTVRARLHVLRQRLRLGTHQRDAHLRGQLNDAINTARQLIGRRDDFAAAFGEPLITKPQLAQIFFQHAPVVLRPARACCAPHVRDQLDVVFAQQREEVREGVATVADGVDGE